MSALCPIRPWYASPAHTPPLDPTLLSPMRTSRSPTAKQKTKTNLRMIANELGISMMTVSRALNGHPGVAATTRKRVLTAADRLRYRPNKLIHAIRSGRSRTIGVMIGVPTSFHARLIHGIHDALAEAGYLPILHFHGPGAMAHRDEQELAYLHRLLDQRVDGIIFWPSDETVPEHYLREVWERGVPLVAIDRNLPLTKADFAGTDDMHGGRLVADYLLSLGHRRLAHIGGEPWVATYADRRRGFEETVCGRPGVTYAFDHCEDSLSGPAARRLLAGPDRPTAVFLASDRMAPHVYAAAGAEGLRIGSDLSVVGFAALTETIWLQPHLTTVDQEPDEIGRAAVRLMIDRLEGKTKAAAPKSVRITPKLVVRESSGLAP